MAIIHFDTYKDLKKSKQKILTSHRRRKGLVYILLAFIILQNLYLIYGR